MKTDSLFLVFVLFLNIACVNPPNNQTKMRELAELINNEEPGMVLVNDWLQSAVNQVEILPRDKDRAEKALYETQVTTRSPMGAVVYETGGILINGGWLRILGSGHPRLDRSLPEWNKGKYGNKTGVQPSVLLIADDVLGGFFAINGGGLSAENIGKVFYFAPDTQEWEPTDLGYSDFIVWCFQGDLNLYYQGFYWEGYENDLKDNISGTQAVAFSPFLFTKEGADINKCARKVVPIEELWNFYIGQ